MMGRSVARRQRNGGPVKRQRIHSTGLPVDKGGTFIRKTALDPQPRIVRVLLECVLQSLPVSHVLLRQSAVLQVIKFPSADRNPQSFPFSSFFLQPLGPQKPR